MKFLRSMVPLLAVGIMLALAVRPLHGADTVAVAKEVVKKCAPSVVRVMGTVKLSMGMMGMNMPAREQKFDVLGTIIDPSGLTVVSNSNIDVSAKISEMTVGSEDGKPNKLNIKAELSALKIRLADGTEVPGKIVLKDQDLDLAFVMPDDQSDEGKKLVGKYPALKLDDAAPASALDEVIVISRLGKNLDYQATVQIGRISAVVTKPRTFYATSGENLIAGVGVPVFNTDGKIVGIQVTRQSGGIDMSDFDMSAMVSAMMPVILPAADVAEIAKQALAKKEPVAAKP